MPISAGDKNCPYQIVSSLGAGGMGEVYRGRGTKLNRDVAIKVLGEAPVVRSAASHPDQRPQLLNLPLILHHDVQKQPPRVERIHEQPHLFRVE
jgi:serine/threonine protein kinase